MQSYWSKFSVVANGIDSIKKAIFKELPKVCTVPDNYDLQITKHFTERVLDRGYPNVYLANILAEIVLNKDNRLKVYGKDATHVFEVKDTMLVVKVDYINGKSIYVPKTIYERGTNVYKDVELHKIKYVERFSVK